MPATDRPPLALSHAVAVRLTAVRRERGRSQAMPGEFRLALVLAGSDTLRRGAQHGSACAGQAWLAPPDATLSASADASRLVAAFTISDDPRVTPEQAWGLTPPLIVPDGVGPCHQRLLRRLGRWLDSPRPLARMQASNDLESALLEMLAHVERQADDGLDDEARLARAEEYALQGLANGIGLADLAAVAGWSRSRFCARFTALRAGTPGAFLARLRLDRAANLLATSTAPVAAIAKACGYGDADTLARAFRRRHGMAPLDWRRQRQGGSLGSASPKTRNRH